MLQHVTSAGTSAFGDLIDERDRSRARMHGDFLGLDGEVDARSWLESQLGRGSGRHVDRDGTDALGQREVRLYSTRADMRHDWREYQDELDPLDYTVSGGNRVTIYSGSGRSVAFLQDEDGSRLAEELENCKNDEEIQTILEPYRC